jgi:hypothetical protein
MTTTTTTSMTAVAPTLQAAFTPPASSHGKKVIGRDDWEFSVPIDVVCFYFLYALSLPIRRIKNNPAWMPMYTDWPTTYAE